MTDATQAGADQTMVVEVSDTTVTEALHDLIETWFQRHFHNSVISRDTQTFNHVRGAVDDLKSSLSASMLTVSNFSFRPE